MKKIIASIKLAPGNRGYFDPLTGINLSISNNIGYIREDDILSNIRRDIRCGKITIVGGQLPPSVVIPKQKAVKEEKKVVEKKKLAIKKEKAVKVKPEAKKEVKQEIKPVEEKKAPVVPKAVEQLKKEEKVVVVAENKKEESSVKEIPEAGV